jgi:hypothetical protein
MPSHTSPSAVVMVLKDDAARWILLEMVRTYSYCGLSLVFANAPVPASSVASHELLTHGYYCLEQPCVREWTNRGGDQLLTQPVKFDQE